MNADIVILGAGIAGLRCGIELLRKRPSLQIVILEKYNYTGGRVVTYHKTLEDKLGKCSKLQWENGAGRIHTSHHKVLELVRKYGLHTINIDDKIQYEEDGIRTDNIFTDTMRLFTSAVDALSHDYLATHTLREVLEQIVGKSETDALALQFPYRAELDTLRADIAMESFRDEMGTYKGYVVVQEGLSALIQAMVKDFEGKGGSLFLGQEVTDIEKDGSLVLVKTKTTSGDVVWEAPCVISTLHSEACREIPFFKSWKTLEYLKMEPLVRTYAVFPTEKGKAWFSDIPKLASSSLLRFFIPMNASCGTVMISYTDGKDARNILHVLNTMGEEKLGDLLVEQARKSFPDKEIPDPLFFKAHPWTSGCTYWLPGTYDPYEESKKSLKPFSDVNVYCCGESFSIRQAWMEGALEQADLLLNSYF
ncbi:MAG: FAD-dependent oxidoreductase [Flavobacteriia bacterium]|nr:FAD-dependent oxidoreductase [Flavobacteriia bacterium]